VTGDLTDPLPEIRGHRHGRYVRIHRPLGDADQPALRTRDEAFKHIPHLVHSLREATRRQKGGLQ